MGSRVAQGLHFGCYDYLKLKAQWADS